MGNWLTSPLPVLSLPPAFAGCTTTTVAENTILTAAAAVPILLAFAPMAVLVTTRSWVRTLQFLREPSLWAAVMNSVIWVLFAFIASKRVDCMELILSYPILLTLNFIYLLMVYGHYGKLWMACIISLLVISCLGYVFYAIRFESFLPMSWETALGIGGLLMLLYSHGCLIEDIKDGDGPLAYAISVLNVVPPGFLNMATLYVILKKHPEQQYIAYSALLGVFGAIIEFMLLISKGIHDLFLGGGNGHPAPPPDPSNVAQAQAQAHAQAAAASAAQAQAAQVAVVQALADLQAAAGQQQQCNVENNEPGLDLSEILVAAAAERPAGGQFQSNAGGQFQSNTAQDVCSRLKEEGLDLGDNKSTMSSNEDLPIGKLPAELTAAPREVKTAELEEEMTQHLETGFGGGDDVRNVELGKNEKPQSVIDDTGAEALKKAKSAIKFLGSGSGDGDDVNKVELRKSEKCKSKSSVESKSKSQVHRLFHGWRKYLLRDTRPLSC